LLAREKRETKNENDRENAGEIADRVEAAAEQRRRDHAHGNA